MLRFTWNRWWAFVLTLCLSTVCALLLTAHFPSVARANTGTYLSSDDQSPLGPSVGDPDVPAGPGQGRVGKGSGVVRSGTNQAVQRNGVGPVGDGVAPDSVLMDRLRLIVLSLRSLCLRF